LGVNRKFCWNFARRQKTLGLHLPPGGFEVLLVAMNLKMFAGLGLCGLIASGTMAQTAAPAVTNLWKVRLPDSGNESSPALASIRGLSAAGWRRWRRTAK
jgi:hypothetical protein